MTKKVLFAIIFCIAILPAISGSAIAFQTSDLEGTWYGYQAEVDTDSGDGYWIRLKLDIDNLGNVETSSTYTDPLDSTKNFTGGKLALDSSGKLSGTLTTFTTYTVTVTIKDGKMDRGKTIAGFAYTTNDDTLGEGTLIKAAGASFQDSNLAGTWHGYLAEVDTDSGDAYWIRLKLDLDSSGNVQTSSTYTDPDGSGGTFTGGSLSLDSSGKLSGTLITSTATVTIEDGKMDQAKTIAGFAYTTDDNTIGEGNLIKADGSFQTNNLKGTWHGYYLDIDSAGDAYWIYATLEVNSSGGVTGGSFTTPYGSESFTGGSLSLNSNGILSGTINTSVPNIVTISHGKMDQGKTIVGFVDKTSVGDMDVGMFIKAGIAGSNVGSQLLLLLD